MYDLARMVALSEEERSAILSDWIPKVDQRIWVMDDMLDYQGAHTIKRVLINGDLEVEGNPYIGTIDMVYYRNRVFPISPQKMKAL